MIEKGTNWIERLMAQVQACFLRMRPTSTTGARSAPRAVRFNLTAAGSGALARRGGSRGRCAPASRCRWPATTCATNLAPALGGRSESPREADDTESCSSSGTRGGATLSVALAAASLAYFGGAHASHAATTTGDLYELAALDASSASVVASLLKPAIGLASLFMIVRIVLTWFPETKSKEFPWIVFYYTTEPVLSFTRQVFQPVGGVDISPIIWVAFLSFMNEILVGPQGILILLSQK